MNEEIEIAGIKVPQVDWAATPASIQTLVVVLSERLQQQDDRIRHLEERLNQNSKNSSKPPSSDGFGKPKGHQKQVKSRKSQEKSKPTSRQVRKLKPSEACDQIQEVLPSVCADCGAPLIGHDEHPHRHQEIELPPIWLTDKS
jgi:transposase